MTYADLINAILQSSVLSIILSTLLGAIARLFYKKGNSRSNVTMSRYLIDLMVDWIIATAAALILHSLLISDSEEIMGVSIILGFIGYKETLKFIKKNFISKFKIE